MTLWVLNTEEEFEQAYDLFCQSGCHFCCCTCNCCCSSYEPLVDGLMTDSPTWLAHWIREKEAQYERKLA